MSTQPRVASESDRREDNTRTWCAGLPNVGTRELTSDERRLLKARSDHALAIRRAVSIAYLVIACAFVAVAAILGFEDIVGVLFTVTAALVLIGGGILVTLRCYLISRYVQGLRADIADSAVLTFSGALLTSETEDETRNRLSQHQLFRAELDSHSLEILPRSQLVLSVDAVPLIDFSIPASTTCTAETPAFAALAADWLQPIESASDSKIESGRRDLSEPEKGELKTATRELRRPLWWGIGFTVYFGYKAYGAFFSGTYQGWLGWLALAFWGVMLFLNVFVYAYRWWKANRYTSDLHEGFVWIVRISPADSTAEDNPVLREILPSSRELWTEGGHPAPWRTSDSWVGVPRKIR